MWYLLRRVYQRYYADEMKKKGSGLRIPTKVKEDTEKYRKDSDKYYEYINKKKKEIETETGSIKYSC